MAPRDADDSHRDILPADVGVGYKLRYLSPATSETHGFVLQRRARCGFEVCGIDARVREGLFAAQEAGALDVPEGGLVGEYLGEGFAKGEGGLGDGVRGDVGRVVVLEVGGVGG